MSKITKLKARIAPFFDLSAWILIVVSMVPLLFIDRAMAVTLAQWSAFGLALSGVAVVISRIAFPQVHFSDLLTAVHRDQSMPAAVVMSSVILFVGLVFLGLVLWAKA